MNASLRVVLCLSLALAASCGDDSRPPDAPDATVERTFAEQLVGIWFKTGLALEFRDDGFAFGNERAAQLYEPQLVAPYTVDDDEITFPAALGCDVGVYRGSVQNDELTLELVDDTCPARGNVPGTYGAIDPLAIYSGPSFFDGAVDSGLFILDVAGDVATQTHTNCADCREVLTYEWERKDNGRFGLVHRVYYDVPPSSGGAVGDLACTATWEVFSLEVPGRDPNALVEDGWILLETDCPYDPPGNFRHYTAPTTVAGSVVALASWREEQGQAFPGYFGESGSAFRLRACPEDERNEFGYCQPTCNASEQPAEGGTCTLPPPTP